MDIFVCADEILVLILTQAAHNALLITQHKTYPSISPATKGFQNSCTGSPPTPINRPLHCNTSRYKDHLQNTLDFSIILETLPKAEQMVKRNSTMDHLSWFMEMDFFFFLPKRSVQWIFDIPFLRTFSENKKTTKSPPKSNSSKPEKMTGNSGKWKKN
jgi:hypothetical protein